VPRPEKPPFHPEEAAAAALKSPHQNVGQNRSLLVVDDNQVVLKAFEMKLKASGFKVTTVSEAEGVASAVEAAQAELIILDINFPSGTGPEWSGFTVIQWLRRFPELAGIPVILVSGEDEDKHREKARAEGAVAYYQKPVNYQELLDVVLHTLKLRE
jgi:CheY-like chemotaxis protein